MKAVALAIALTMGGCVTRLAVDQTKVVDPPEGFAQALQMTVEFYGLRSFPPIVWYGVDGNGCGSGYGYIGAVGDCVDGESDDGLIILSTMGGQPMHRTSLGHELGHRTSDERGEGGDEDHEGHFFRDPGDDLSKRFDGGHGLVGENNRRLLDAGL